MNDSESGSGAKAISANPDLAEILKASGKRGRGRRWRGRLIAAVVSIAVIGAGVYVYYGRGAQ